MNLLEKAREYQKAVNMAMTEYEEAKKAYDKVNMAKVVIKVVSGEEEIDTTMYGEKKADFGISLVRELCMKEGQRLEASEKRLAVLIGDKELLTQHDSAEQPQSNEKQKENETTVNDKHGQENESNDILNSKELLYKEYVTNDMTVPQIVEKYKVGKYDVVNALNKFGIKKGKRKSTPSNTNKR